ncbi:OsmC family protein [Moheibacter lacus]|uniref:OsmC family protein n=1 Tax=Moheibacter lacus TaxID=2745851 RepID=A0A838ZGG1_9FLAO|nr:OsmC family protein [Moheibacter lacus]MBA5628358.1 OsmC family protein [Moheibacter lacus]
MTNIQINYHNDSNSFIAEDEFGNIITFRSDRETHENSPTSTGKNLGPMLSLLMAVGACSGIDIVMILDKQRQEFDQLSIKVSGEREKDKTPALWETIHVAYYLEGDLDKDKANRAAELSITKYCSVLETLRRAGAEVSYEVFVNTK